MQRVESREPEPIWCVEQMKELPHELWRTRILRIPRVGENQEVGADQSQVAVGCRLVDYDLRTRRVQYARAHQGPFTK